MSEIVIVHQYIFDKRSLIQYDWPEYIPSHCRKQFPVSRSVQAENRSNVIVENVSLAYFPHGADSWPSPVLIAKKLRKKGKKSVDLRSKKVRIVDAKMEFKSSGETWYDEVKAPPGYYLQCYGLIIDTGGFVGWAVAWPFDQ